MGHAVRGLANSHLRALVVGCARALARTAGRARVRLTRPDVVASFYISVAEQYTGKGTQAVHAWAKPELGCRPAGRYDNGNLVVNLRKSRQIIPVDSLQPNKRIISPRNRQRATASRNCIAPCRKQHGNSGTKRPGNTLVRNRRCNRKESDAKEIGANETNGTTRID